MIIPVNTLEHETLNAIIEAFILREGTDYGAEETSLAEKIAQVRRQLEQGLAIIVYSELHETVNIMAKDSFDQDMLA